jgi:ABC-type Zn uptake system ZnuABC Zn-binding protein ZnuA
MKSFENLIKQQVQITHKQLIKAFSELTKALNAGLSAAISYMQHPENRVNQALQSNRLLQNCRHEISYISQMPYLATKYQICCHKVYLQEVLGTCDLVFLLPASGA